MITPIFNIESVKPQLVMKRQQQRRGKQRLIESIQNANWNNVFLTISCVDKFQRFNEQLMGIINACLPWKTIKKHAGTKPWVTDQFIETIKLRNKYWRQDKYGLIFKYYRNKANKMRTRLRASYVERQVADGKTPKQLWSTVKQIVGSESPNDHLQSLINDLFDGNVENFVNEANDFFISVASDIEPLNMSQVPELATAQIIPDEYLPNVMEVEILMDKVKLTKAIGPDTIPNWIWKDCHHVLAAPIASIICDSMRNGVWSDEWKSADVIPLEKTSHPTCIRSDLRPIGLTSVISKAAGEYFMVKYLWSFIKEKIDSNQFGVIKGGSTTNAMISLIHKLLEASDNGLISRILLVDFSKAFDRIDHTVLIRKLLDMEVPVWLCKWIAGFLTDRKQRVKYKGKYSEWKKIPSGIPQGTKFGPIAFVVMVNSLLAHIKFVDDSTIVETLSDTNMSSLGQRAQITANWAKEHKMILNPKKTTEMRVCFKRSIQQWNPIIIGNDPIKQVSSAKVLGFYINNKLTWDDHIQKIVAKANSRLHLLRAMMRAKFPKDALISFYVSSIRSILEYGAPVWNFNITTQQNKILENIQRRVLKMIDGIPPTDHDYDYVSLLQKYKMKSLDERRGDLCESLFKSIITNPDHQLYKLFPLRPNTTRTRSNATFQLSHIKSDRFLRSFIPTCILSYQQ